MVFEISAGSYLKYGLDQALEGKRLLGRGLTVESLQFMFPPVMDPTPIDSSALTSTARQSARWWLPIPFCFKFDGWPPCLNTIAVCVLAVMAGCASPLSTFEIVDYRNPGDTRRYGEVFEEAFYDIDADGNVDVVLRHVAPPTDSATPSVTQIIHLRTFWRSIPGKTVAHRTQLNATVRYHLVAGETGAVFEGAGSVFFEIDQKTGGLEGVLEMAKLQPRRQMRANEGLFRHATLQGRFAAKRDPRRVTRMIHEMNRLFGN